MFERCQLFLTTFTDLCWVGLDASTALVRLMYQAHDSHYSSNQDIKPFPYGMGTPLVLHGERKLLLRGFLVPIINTTFIELSTAAYLNISFSPRPILRLNFSFLLNENSQPKPIPQTVSSVDMNQTSSSKNKSSENSSNGNKPVFRYRNTRKSRLSSCTKRKTTW